MSTWMILRTGCSLMPKTYSDENEKGTDGTSILCFRRHGSTPVRRIARSPLRRIAPGCYPRDMTKMDHPNESGKWTRLETAGNTVLWRRDRSDPFPVTQFYLVAPPRQTEVLYDEARARAQFSALSGSDTAAAA